MCFEVTTMQAFVYLLIFSISLPALAKHQCGLQGNNLRVVGGQQTKPNQYPWMLRLEIIWIDGKHVFKGQCGASIIDEQFAITAAHCLNRPKKFSNHAKLDKIRLIGGDWSKSRRESTEIHIAGATKVTHHLFNKTGHTENDIGLIKFARRLDFNGRDKILMPICLSKQATKLVNGDECKVVGWGRTSPDGPNSDVLKEVKVAIRPDKDCYSYAKEYDPVAKLCAGGKLGQNSCQGDSGGPLQCPMANGAWILTGIVSYGIGGCAKERPAFYARVESYIDWIEEAKKKM